MLSRRPVVIVEDSYQHLSDLAKALKARAASLRSCVTFVSLDQDGPGPDTATEVERWLSQTDLDLQVVTLDSSLARNLKAKHPKRFDIFPKESCRDMDAYVSLLEQLVRSGGVLLQDVVLEPLSFTSDRRWLSVYAAGMIKDRVKPRQPSLWFMSNKEGHFAPLKDALMAVGCDLSRQFFDKRKKDEWPSIAAAAIESHCADKFSFWLQSSPGEWRVIGVDDRKDVASELDIVVWLDVFGKSVVEGRLVNKSIELELESSHQLAAWVHLIRAHIEGRQGVPTIAFGLLKGREDDDERAVNDYARELGQDGKDFNPSSRLANKMKHALLDPRALITRENLYLLSDTLAPKGEAARRARYGIVRRKS